ncbi:nipped-B-like protein [Thrips palmi]|uniref:Nipped-B protein n=1 Tax=Thrips palmi TaxID=161013 RepID=A0A6P8ZGT7_THRPL|nr:nipped-B-like protein [Thrips palmi]XP_034230675.1 nipped-B-like protein [Thrips palmi]
MNGEIPSVPITTLAGISSLTDLLPEMPLPSPLPLSSKSLLFHPRVAEEAQNLLSVRDESLVPQLIQSLSQTSSQHIELKDHYAGTEPPVEQQQNIPELLKAILHRNPNVFKGPPANSSTPVWNQNFNCNDSSPASYSQESPNISYSGLATGQFPQDQVPGPVPVPIPPPDPGPHQRVSVITEQYKPPIVHNNFEANDLASAVKDESSLLQAPPRSGGVQGDLPNSTQEPSSIPRTNAMQIAGSSPAQASTAPVTQEQDKSKLLSGRHSRRTNSVNSNSNADAKVTGESSSSLPASVQIPDIMKLKDLKEPVVRLNRLSEEDQALMQKSLKAFAEKSPSLANQLGILSPPSSNHRSAHNSTSYKEDSGSDSDEPLQKSKYFKSRDKEREEKRLKEKDSRKKARAADSDNEYVPDDDSAPQSMRKRRHANSNDGGNPVDDFVPKTKLRKVERKLAPAAEKLSVEELMETNTYQRFSRSIDLVFDNTEDLDLNTEMEDDADVPPEALIPKYQLQELCGEAAKLKNLGAMESFPADRLVRLLNILEKNIRDGVRVCPLADPDEDEEESKLWLELAMERVMRAVDASLTSMYILTSPNMPKRIYLEDVIDRVVVFCKFQLVNTIYPSFDPVYRVENKAKSSKDDHPGSGRKKKEKHHSSHVKDKSIQTLYNKLHELVGLLSELLNVQVLTDTTVLHASSLGVGPFFVEGVSELQLSALRLVTSIFTKYDKHRRLLLDDILASIARLPSSKRSLRTYRLSSDENIQMLTALVLQLIQCVVVLPETLQDQLMASAPKAKDGKAKSSKEEEKKPEIVSNCDRDVFIAGKYDTAMRTAANFLSVFLNKCGNKSEEIDYRPLFENFVQDLLTTVNKPEWPAAELLLSLLGTLLVTNFVNKGTDMALRVASLDYLGVVAARLRKDAVQSQLKVDHIDQIIREIKAEELKEEDGSSSSKSSKQGKGCELDEEEERNQFLQRVLLDYLAVNGHNDQALIYARHFYLAQWYKDASSDRRKSPSKSPSKKKNQRGRKKRKDESSEEETEPSDDDDDDEDKDEGLNDTAQTNSEKFRLTEIRKNFLVSKIRPFQDSTNSGSRQQVMQTYLDYTSAELISRFLASKRPFSQSFDMYLKQILRVLTESSIAIRTKAMKCLTMVVEADPAVLGRVDMQLGVRHSFLDHSTSVREAAVDLVGKFVLSRPELIDKYYEMLSARILDTGVSVRKRVIKILKDICIECPDFPKIPEICVKMIRRVNDEEGIRKLVMEVFQNMWFTPVRERPSLDTVSLIRKVMNITDVVATSRGIGMEWFEQLLVSLFRPREDKEDSTKVHAEPPKALLTACKQIVDCLIENVLRLEESSNTQNKGSSQRLVACLTTLNLFAKIRPQLLVNHAITLQPYLSLRCQTQGDYQIISCVARTLELVVPLMEHPSETFLAQLEEDSVKLILQHDRSVVASCLSCLGSVVNNVTRNFKLIRDCFNKYYSVMRDVKEKDLFLKQSAASQQTRPYVRRALFTVGLLLRHFDFTNKDVIEGLDEDIKNQVFETLIYFVKLDDKDIQIYTLRAIGSLCIRHYDFMLQSDLKALYHGLLTGADAPLQMKVQVLNNIEMYLEEEEQRMIRQDQEWAKMSKSENLKEMGDVTSGMASTVIQLYLKEIMDAFLNPDVSVRHAALKVIQLILAQGLVHPVQIVPYLICMSTDMEKVVSHSADKQLQDIEKKYPGFIHMKSQLGIRLSFKLHCILQQGPKGEYVPVRGHRQIEGEPLPTALNGFLYSILRSTKQQRRALVLSILKQFDEQTKTSLSQMLYYADNLAYFPYQVQDEPLFIIHHVDIMISVAGTNLMQTFKEALIPLNNQVQRLNLETGQPELVSLPEPDEDDEEDADALLARMPQDTSVLQDVITAFQGCLLLLVLKQHLKDLYGFTDAKITQYSPSEAAKVYEKAVSRKSNAVFNPKATLAKLKEGSSQEILDQAQRKAIITQYLDFKQMMLKFDPDDAEEDEEGSPGKSGTPGRADNAGGTPYQQEGIVPPITLTINASHGDNSPDKVRINNVQSADGTPQRIPKLTIVAPKRSEIKERHHRKSHKSDKHKKHRHKKKRKKNGGGSDEDSDDFSDPDFLV